METQDKDVILEVLRMIQLKGVLARSRLPAKIDEMILGYLVHMLRGRHMFFDEPALTKYGG